MAYTIMMRWDGVGTPLVEQLPDARAERPDQCVHHRAVQRGACLQITQTWRTGGAFDDHLRTVLGPALRAAGVPQEPQLAVFEIADLFLPRGPVHLPEQRTTASTTESTRLAPS